MIDITDDLVNEVAVACYENGGKQATYGTPWAELDEFQQGRVTDMVRDVLEGLNAVTEARS